MAARGGTMNRTTRGGTPLLPAGVRDFLRRRSREGFGLLLIAAGFAAIVACLGYQPGDPSFNNATAAGAQNLLGRPGAYVADLLLQLFGLLAALPPLLLIAWGLRLLRAQPVTLWWLRLALLPALLVPPAVALSVVPMPADWPLGAGLGGALGELVLLKIQLWSEIDRGWLALAALLLTPVALSYLYAIDRSQWLGFGRGLWALASGGGRWLMRPRPDRVPLIEPEAPARRRNLDEGERMEPR
ncbi:MAG: DNA translocase FtsK 4TM domain-containing protein, partial [Kiloniellales bacterium]